VKWANLYNLNIYIFIGASELLGCASPSELCIWWTDAFAWLFFSEKVHVIASRLMLLISFMTVWDKLEGQDSDYIFEIRPQAVS
jgi:putative Ca2+/H+ antiporter (TMEM165/GDT1 family)